MLFPVWTIVKDTHHHESPTRSEQYLNLCRTRVQAFLSEVVPVAITTTPSRADMDCCPLIKHG